MPVKEIPITAAQTKHKLENLKKKKNIIIKLPRLG